MTVLVTADQPSASGRKRRSRSRYGRDIVMRLSGTYPASIMPIPANSTAVPDMSPSASGATSSTEVRHSFCTATGARTCCTVLAWEAPAALAV